MTTPGASGLGARAYASSMPSPAAAHTPGMKACLFCGTMYDQLTCEHVIPKWARRSYGIQGTPENDPGKTRAELARRDMADKIAHTGEPAAIQAGRALAPTHRAGVPLSVAGSVARSPRTPGAVLAHRRSGPACRMLPTQAEMTKARRADSSPSAFSSRGVTSSQTPIRASGRSMT
jgi:hypothetical protein